MNDKLFDPSVLGKNYEPDLTKYEMLGKKANLGSASLDTRRIMLLIVDAQRDFVHPDGALSVPGAIEDTERLINWIYTNAGVITTIGASLDTHKPKMIFHPQWWKNIETGKNPEPYTMITFADIKDGKWQALFDPIWSVHYVDLLEKQAKKNLMVWPYHCIEATDGQKLVAALHEAIAYHAAARETKPEFITKGTVAQVEHYGIFAAEIAYPKNADASGLNTVYLDMIAQYDLIYVAGEAKSHCVMETMKQMLSYFSSQPEVIAKIRFLMDCTSSVAHPTIDFEALAMADLKDMEKKGVVMVTSQDPIS